MDNGYLGNNLRKLRQDNKISQNKLGDMLGVSGAYIQQLEKGVKTNPSIDLIYKISTYFDISPIRLLEWDLSNEHQDFAKENDLSKLLRANALKNDENYNTEKNFKQLFAKPSELFAGPGKYIRERSYDPVKELQNVGEDCLENEKDMILELVKHYNLIYCNERYDLSKMNEEHFIDLKVMFYTTIKTVLKDCIK